jgi:hypothetical protein
MSVHVAQKLSISKCTSTTIPLADSAGDSSFMPSHILFIKREKILRSLDLTKYSFGSVAKYRSYIANLKSNGDSPCWCLNHNVPVEHSTNTQHRFPNIFQLLSDDKLEREENPYCPLSLGLGDNRQRVDTVVLIPCYFVAVAYPSSSEKSTYHQLCY